MRPSIPGLLLSLLFVSLSSFLFAQNQNNIWFFGSNAGLDFNTDPSTALQSDLVTLEGTASISDPSGQLLFYTNGATLWDRLHNVMPNGSGLLGGESSSQAALIVPLPNSCSQYYVFTTEDHLSDGGMHYSIVDMCLNGGLGDVIVESKNTLVVDHTAEKATAVLHENGVDIWIITHLLESESFHAYLLTSSGLNPTPVVSSVGSYYPVNGHIGAAKASHDGNKLVSVATFHGIAEMFDFNNATGVISNEFDLATLFDDFRWFYGIEFSPDDNLLYIATTFSHNYLYQINLANNDITLLNDVSGNYAYGALQLGPDGKIYMARGEEEFLDVIHAPNNIGMSSQYEEAGLQLIDGTHSTLGLPNFAPYSFLQDTIPAPSLGNDTTLCTGASLLLNFELDTVCDVSYLWSDGSTGNQLLVTQAGTYWVQGESACINFTDTIEVAFEACQPECDNESSGIIFGANSGNERGYSLVPTADGTGFYVGGFKNDSITIIKMNTDGSIEWYRTFDVSLGLAAHVTRIILDSDGMLVLAGNHGGFPNGNAVFVIKYDPNANQILWSRGYELTPQLSHYSLLQKGTGGNYVFSLSTIYDDPQTDNSNVIEVDKDNGDLVSPFIREYDLGASDGLAEIVYHNGFIYGTGRYTDGGSPADMRHTLVKLDADDGSQVWVRMGHVAANQTARLYGADLIILQNTIYSAYFGDPDGTSTIDNIMYVQQTTLDGEVMWVRSYNIPGALGDAAVELIASDGGIVVYAKERFSVPMLVLFKIDLNGEIVWSNSYEFPGNILSFLEIENARSSQLITVNDKLVFTAFGINENNGTNSVVVITDLDGQITEGCVESNFVQMTSAEISNPVFYVVNPTMITRQPDVINLSVTVRNSIPNLQCIMMDTLTEEVHASICQGEIFEGYSVTGTFIDTFTTNVGCDSIRILHLTVIAPITFSFSQEICFGEVFEGYSTSGIFIDTFEAQTGCDSIRTLSLTVNPPVTFTLDKNICHNETFEGYTISGIYADTFALSNGCDSIRILNLSVFACAPIIYYDLNACRAYMEDGSVMDYSEFTPAYPEGSCAEVSAEILQRIPATENKHSCTPGVNNTIAMCVSSYSSCTYSAGNAAAIVIDFNIVPFEDSLFRLQGFQFYEKAPTTYSWVDGDSGPNNYPTRYGIRILKNGVEIFRDEDVQTNLNWTLQSYNFIDNDLFSVETATDFRIELLPYCPVGNGALVSAWDIDEVRIIAACLPIDNNSTIAGTVSTKDQLPISDVQILLADNPLFNNERNNLTDAQGEYIFENVEPGACYLKGYKNDDVLNGVSALDLVHIQRHLLGKSEFTTLNQYVAADVNHNNNVNTIDLVDIQKLLLGKTTEFPRNTSWRFGALPQDMTGEDISQFRELHLMEIAEPGTYEADLVGIKIGDVNGDVQLFNTPKPIDARSIKSFSVVIEEQNSILHVKAGEETEIAGMQLALQIQNVEYVQSGKLQLESSNYFASNDGSLRLVWTSKESLKISKGDVLFSIVLKSNQTTSIAVDKVLSAELYTDELEVLNIDMIFANNSAIAQPVDRFSVEPNPFQSELTIRLDLEKEGDVQINFYDLSGRLLYQKNNYYLPGQHTQRIAGNLLGVVEGVFYCQIVSNGQTSMQRIVRVQ